jgi:nicotinic acid mononucleotide adenylyltransferase
VRKGHEEVSSTEVRERIARGEPWEHLVPEKIRARVREIYS